MKLAILLILSGTAFGQVRYDSRVVTVASNVPVGANAPVLAIPNALVTICMDGNCITKAPVFSDAGLSVPVANPQKTDGQGRFGFWASAGNYFYKVVLPSGALVGIYPITLGGSGGGGGGITQLTGDVTAAGSGSVPATLATVNTGSGACGDATHVCAIITDPKGRTTTQTPVAITAGGLSSFSAPSASWPAWLVPTVTNGTTAPSLAVAASSIPNSALANPSTTVNGQTCTLGSSCTVSGGSSGISGQTVGYAIEAATATTATGPFPLDDAVTLANYITAHKKLQVVSGGTDPSQLSLVQTGFAPTVVTSAFTLAAPTAVSTPSTLVGFAAPCSGLWNLANSSGIMTSTCTSILPVANGGTGTATPALAAGTNVTITGSWPNQTINSSAGGGTVTAVSIATANGVSGTSSGGATPALTIALAAITPTSVASSGPVSGTTGTFTGGVTAGTTGGVGGQVILPEGTAATASTGNDVCYGDSTAHDIKCSLNNGSFFPLVSTASAPLSISAAGVISAPTAVTSASSLTSNAVVIGGGSQASSTISADTTTTHALFATAGAPAFRALAATDVPAALSSTTSVNGTTIPASATLTQTIASGTSALGTAAIASGACATVVTTTATGTASTDAITWNPNGSIKAVTGYIPSTLGGLTISDYPTTNAVNWDVCNWTSASITPGAVTLNWRVAR